MTLRSPAVLMVSSLLIATPRPVAGQGRAIVLDVAPTERPALVAIDATTGATLAKTELQGLPTSVVRSPDGSRFVVHEPGNGPLFLRALPNARPGADQTLAVIDAASLKVLNQIWLGPAQNASVRDGLFSPDGSRLTLIVDEFKAPDKMMIQHRAIVCLNLKSGQVAGWVAVPNELRKGPVKLIGLPDQDAALAISTEARGTKPGLTTVAFLDLKAPAVTSQFALEGDPMWSGLSNDSKFLVLVQRMGTAAKNAPAAPTRVRFIDLSSGQAAVSLELKGSIDTASRAVRSPRGEHLYLLDTANNRLDVIGMDSRTLATSIAVGQAARFSIVGPDRDVLVVDEAAGAAAGTVRLLRDAGVAATAGLPPKSTVTRSRDGQRLHASSEQGEFVRLTWPALQQVGIGPVRLPSNRHTVKLTSDGSRAVSLNADSTLTIIELDTGQQIGPLATAATKDPEMVKKWLLYGLATAANVAANANLPTRLPSDGQEPTREVLEVRQPFAYVLDPEAGEVIIVDTDAARITEKLPAPGQSMRPVPGGSLLAVEDVKTLRLIDTATNKKPIDIDFPLPAKTYAPLFLMPLKSGAVFAARGAAAYIIDGTTGKPIAPVGGLRRVTHVLIDP